MKRIRHDEDVLVLKDIVDTNNFQTTLFLCDYIFNVNINLIYFGNFQT